MKYQPPLMPKNTVPCFSQKIGREDVDMEASKAGRRCAAGEAAPTQRKPKPAADDTTWLDAKEVKRTGARSGTPGRRDMKRNPGLNPSGVRQTVTGPQRHLPREDLITHHHGKR
jgi:hypothetical protein